MRFITLDIENKVISTREGPSIVNGEIESQVGEFGQIMQPDGSFITPEPVLAEPQPTLEEMQTQTLLNTEYLVIMSELTSQ